ncbi:hypothetical protein DENSPDRAFT_51389 [Dentipellis sp. KUC8613]|nr:hypothetical protein DENSPDRAFT_51389 [Dentipellis sp. KUC8613]
MDNNGQSSQIPNSDNTQLSLMNFAQRVITPEEYQRNMERLAEIQRMNEIGLQNYAQQEYERVQEGIKAQKRLQQLQQALGRPLVVVPDQNQQNQQTSEAHRSHTTSQSFNTQGSTSQARSASHAPASEAPARQGSNTPIGYRGTPPTYAPSTLHAQPAPASSFSYPQTVNIPPYQAHSGVQAYPSSGYAQWYPAGNQNQTQFTRFSQSAANASVPQPTFVANQGTTSQTGSQKATAPSTTVFSSYASNVASSATRPRATSSGHTAQTPPVARSSHDFRIPDYMKEQWDAWVKNYGEAQAQEMAKRYFEIVQQKAQLSNASDTTNRPSSDNLRGHIPATTVGAQSSSGPGATQAASAAVPHVYAPTVPIRNSASLATATGQSSSGSHTSSVPKIFDIPVVPRPSELASQISAAQQPPAKETHSTGARATPPQNSQPSQLQTAANRLSSRQSTHPYAPHSYPATSQTQVRPAPAAKPLFKWNELAPLPTPAKKQETASAPGTSQPTSASAIGRKPTLARDILRAFGVKSVDKSAEAGVGSKRKRSPEPSEAQHSDSPAAKKAAQSTTESASSTPSSVPKTVPIPNLVLPSRPQSTNAPALPTLSRSASSNASVPPSREDPDLTDEDPHAGAPASQEPEPIPIPMANEHPAPGESNLPTFQPHTFLSHGTTFAPTTSNPILFSNIVFPTLAQATRTPSPELHAVITAVDDEDEPMAAQAEPQEEERSSVEESAVEATILPEVIDLTAESPAPEAGSDAPPQAPAPNPDGRTPQPPVDVTLSDDPTVQQPGQLISAAKALARSPAVEVEMSREEAAYVLVPPMADYLRRLKNRVAADRPADSRDGGGASA